MFTIQSVPVDQQFSIKQVKLPPSVLSKFTTVHYTLNCHPELQVTRHNVLKVKLPPCAIRKTTIICYT